MKYTFKSGTMHFCFQTSRICTSPLCRIINEKWFWFKVIAQIFQFAISATAERNIVRSTWNKWARDTADNAGVGSVPGEWWCWLWQVSVSGVMVLPCQNSWCADIRLLLNFWQKVISYLTVIICMQRILNLPVLQCWWLDCNLEVMVLAVNVCSGWPTGPCMPVLQ